ncbi:alpha/beta hydrolase-fold protein [soil metagenome]
MAKGPKGPDYLRPPPPQRTAPISGYPCRPLTAGVLLVAGCSPAGLHVSTVQADAPARHTAAVALPDAHSFTLTDKRENTQHRIYVALPTGYGSSEDRYPVLFLLDAAPVFAHAAQLTRILSFDSSIPGLLLVGIGYDPSATDRVERRIRDLTPSKTATATSSGGGQEFLAFLAETVVPLIDSAYRTNPQDRAITGHSLGGLFALYALFERPELFRRVVATSPSLWWDDGFLFRLEQVFSRAHEALPKSVYLSVGTREPNDMQEFFGPFVDSLGKRGYAGLNLTAETLPGETHLSALPTGLLRGLRSVYASVPGKP